MEGPPFLVAPVHRHSAVDLRILSLVPISTSGGAMIEGTEVVCGKGVISTGPAEAARIGARIFEQGGTAGEAVAAACLACAVLEPQAVDLGGYVAAAVALDGKTGKVFCIDANSVAPAAAHENMYEILPPRFSNRGINEIEYGCSVRNDANVYGPMSVG